MKVVSRRIVGLASLTVLCLISYLALERGLVEAINAELSRYQDINSNYLYIFILLIVFSYFLGWAKSKLKIQNVS
ncbi:MAG: hypothetical protein PHW75_02700 [Patescibacteria group bacterium]|nr:hypothetical protein [Patescibacteria group bacterium]